MTYRTRVMTHQKFEEYRKALLEHIKATFDLYSMLEAEVYGTYKAEEYNQYKETVHKLFSEALQMRYPQKAVDKKRELERDRLYSPATRL